MNPQANTAMRAATTPHTSTILQKTAFLANPVGNGTVVKIFQTAKLTIEL
jgi:hypothetical protein